ncbi:MAG: hypothetical protein ACYSSI_06755 [Planctomycetota bacterium]
MVKRISCRIISSVPFGKTSAGFSSVRRPNSHQYEIGSVPIANIRFKHNCNLGNDNPKAFNIDLGILNDFPIGQILDCYA